MVRVTLPPAVESKGKVSTIPEAAVPSYRIGGREIGSGNRIRWVGTSTFKGITSSDPQSSPADPDLLAVITSWATLPATIKISIIAMLGATTLSDECI